MVLTQLGLSGILEVCTKAMRLTVVDLEGLPSHCVRQKSTNFEGHHSKETSKWEGGGGGREGDNCHC